MSEKESILARIKNTVKETEPTATLILYGSYARGDNREDSDIDLLILVDKDKLTFNDETKIMYPLYEIELETGILISPLVLPKSIWQTTHKISPFYHNVTKEGIIL